LIAGNWKMNTDRAAACEIAMQLKKHITAETAAEVLICPPFVYLDSVSQIVDGCPIELGAQNVYHQSNGAFTGEISTEMLIDVGCKYVILGHSERRHVLGESDSQVNEKVHAAISAGLVAIVCVGETLEQRENNQTQSVVLEQFEGSLAGISDASMESVVIAYEPVWAIGTGKVATPEQAQEVHADLRSVIEKRYNSEIAGKVRILYGGSVKPDNAVDLLQQKDIDGALVGGASLNPEGFVEIVVAGQE
jgi:triosephosphate isomerase